MSEISRLAEGFEQRSKQQAESTEKAVRSAFKKHERALLSALSESEKRTSAAIRDQNRRLSAIALKGWLWIVLVIFLLLTSSAGLIWWMGQEITANAAEIQRQSRALDQLAAEGSRIELSRCGESRRLCVAIDAESGRYKGENGTLYLIPRGY